MRLLRVARFVPATAVFAGTVAIAAPGCQDATQVDLDIRMSTRAKCSEIRGTAITVGVEPSQTESRVRESYVHASTKQCDEVTRAIGTLVVTPGDDGDRASVVVVVAYDPKISGPEACQPPGYDGCIVARRRFNFAKHKRLTMPITIDPECKDRACDAFSTCRQGFCFSSEVDTSAPSGGGGGAGGQILEPGETPDGGTNPDAAVPVTDGGDIDPPPDSGSDGSTDAGGTDSSTDAGGYSTPFCSGTTLYCNMSSGSPSTCALSDGGRNACCATGGPTPMCTPACVAPDRYCCSSADCGDNECCGLPVAPNEPRRCGPKTVTDGGFDAMPGVGCFDNP